MFPGFTIGSRTPGKANVNVMHERSSIVLAFDIGIARTLVPSRGLHGTGLPHARPTGSLEASPIGRADR